MDEKIKIAIDLLVMMVIRELTLEFNENEDELIKKFIHSKTGKLLYDEKSKLWWCGPSDIVEMYKKEISNKAA